MANLSTDQGPAQAPVISIPEGFANNLTPGAHYTYEDLLDAMNNGSQPQPANPTAASYGLPTGGISFDQLTQMLPQLSQQGTADPSASPQAAPGQAPAAPTGIPSVSADKQANEDLIAKEGAKMFGSDQVPALLRIVEKESGFKNTAQNPTSTAYGLFQFLDGTWKGAGIPKTSDPNLQTQAGLQYIKNRYGTPNAALQFHNETGWY